MAVGFSSQQLALNQACGRAMQDQALAGQPQWLRDYIRGTQAISDKKDAMLPLLGALVGGAGVRAPGGAISVNPPTQFTSGRAVPNAVTGPAGETFAIPQYGPANLSNTGKGLVYPIPNPASHGLSQRVGSVRVMDPTDSKQNGYVVYQNSNPTNPQAVHPVTGQTMKKSDPYWHIEFGPND